MAAAARSRACTHREHRSVAVPSVGASPVYTFPLSHLSITSGSTHPCLPAPLLPALTDLTSFSWWKRYSKRARARAGRVAYRTKFSLDTSMKGPPGSVSMEAWRGARGGGGQALLRGSITVPYLTVSHTCCAGNRLMWKLLFIHRPISPFPSEHASRRHWSQAGPSALCVASSGPAPPSLAAHSQCRDAGSH